MPGESCNGKEVLACSLPIVLNIALEVGLRLQALVNDRVTPNTGRMCVRAHTRAFYEVRLNFPWQSNPARAVLLRRVMALQFALTIRKQKVWYENVVSLIRHARSIATQWLDLLLRVD